jgi:O-antigen/teichoic acid export membrane protein
MSSLIIYISISSILPILKQMFILKFLNSNFIALYGVLFANASFFIGFSDIGWADISAIKTSQKKSIYNEEKFFSYHLAIYSIILFNIFFMPLAFYIQNLNIYFLPFVVLYSIMLSVFNLNNKIIRSYNILKLFFILIIIKNFIDIFLFILLSFLNEFSIGAIFLSEVLSSILVILYTYRLKIFYRYKFNIYQIIKLFDKYKLFFTKNKSHAFNIFIISIFSLIIVYSDRILYYHILTKEEYVEFLFYLLIINLSMSVNALFYNLSFNKLSKLQLSSKEEIINFLDISFLKLVKIIFILPALIIITSYIQSIFYPHIVTSITNISLAFLYGTLIIINIYEKYNMLAKNKYMKYLQIFSLIIFLCIILSLYSMSILNLNYAFITIILTRIIYIILNRKIIKLSYKE